MLETKEKKLDTNRKKKKTLAYVLGNSNLNYCKLLTRNNGEKMDSGTTGLNCWKKELSASWDVETNWDLMCLISIHVIVLFLSICGFINNNIILHFSNIMSFSINLIILFCGSVYPDYFEIGPNDVCIWFIHCNCYAIL